MSRGTFVALVVIAAVLAAGGGYWFGQSRSPVPQSGPGAAGPVPGQAKGPGAGGPGGGAGQPVSVEVTKVATASLPQAIVAVGSLRSDESVTLRPEVAGRISEILFTEGQRVVKGAILLRLDQAINEAEVQQARANQVLAKSKYERAVDLSKSNFISGQARDEAESNMKVADAALALAEARLARNQIKAPFAGVIGLRQVSLGDYVKEGADLVNLESIDLLKVDFRVPEIYMSQIRAGQPLEIALDAIPGRTYQGRVLAINPLVDAAGRAVVIRAQVNNTQTTLRPGMFARVRLITAAREDALVVPEQALVPQGQDQFVFRIVDGKAQRSKVEIGQRGDGKVEIRQGLAAGDLVVVAGQLKLREGTPVTVVEASRPPVTDGLNDGAAVAPGGGAPTAVRPKAVPSSKG